ncbi:hypothetical protein RJZ57_000075 [Blastomyces gilchristii]
MASTLLLDPHKLLRIGPLLTATATLTLANDQNLPPIPLPPPLPPRQSQRPPPQLKSP